jgi:ABC-type oligopeptide transport system substrate-binding subunit
MVLLPFFCDEDTLFSPINKPFAMDNVLKNLTDSAKDFAEKAAEKLHELKETATEKVEEWSEKAEHLAADVKQEAAEKLAEAQAAGEKIAQHEGGALGYLSEKAREIAEDVKEEASVLAEEGKDFWEKAKEFAGGKAPEKPESTVAEEDSTVPPNNGSAV